MYQVRYSLAWFAACGDAFANGVHGMTGSRFDSARETGDRFAGRRFFRPEHPKCFASFVTSFEIDDIARPDTQRFAGFLGKRGLAFGREFESWHKRRHGALPYL